jgi:hypothetical protein
VSIPADQTALRARQLHAGGAGLHQVASSVRSLRRCREPRQLSGHSPHRHVLWLSDYRTAAAWDRSVRVGAGDATPTLGQAKVGRARGGRHIILRARAWRRPARRPRRTGQPPPGRRRRRSSQLPPVGATAAPVSCRRLAPPPLPSVAAGWRHRRSRQLPPVGATAADVSSRRRPAPVRRPRREGAPTSA